MLKKIVIIGCLIFTPLTYGKDITIRLESGTLTLGDFLEACEEAAECKSSKVVQTNIPGKIISIKDVPYEVRFFSFEDTSGKISPDTTFREYAQKNNLLTIKSVSIKPLPGIQFESFDFRGNSLKDGVYYSMAVRKLENGDN